jgi:alcohol dehydrogenase (NADP+)
MIDLRDGIVSDVEMVEIQQLNGAYEPLEKNGVNYRFVIDMASFKRA